MATTKQSKKLITTEDMANQLASLGLSIDVVQTDAPEELIQLTAHEFNKSSISIARAGFYLLNLKSLVNHGEFGELIKKHGVPSQRASEAMNVAQSLMQLPPNVAKKLITLPKTKTMALAKIDANDLEKMAETGELDELAEYSRDDLRDYVRNLQTKNVNIDMQLQTALKKQDDLTQRLKSKNKNSLYPDFVEMARMESTALSNKAILAVDDLERLHQELANIETMQDKKDPDAKRFMKIARSSLYHNLNATVAKFNTLLTEIITSYDEEIIGDVSAEIYFNDEQALVAGQQRELLIAEHKQEALIRDNERALNKKKRGKKA